MKLTTKIVLGIIGSVFILSIGAIVGFSFTDRINYRYNHSNFSTSIPQENVVGLDVVSYKTVILDVPEANMMQFIGNLNIRPITNDSDINKLFLPEALVEYTHLQSFNDTLTIKLDVERLKSKYEIMKEEYGVRYHTELTGINFTLHNNFVDLISNSEQINMDIRDVKTDLIKINTVSCIDIENCQVKVLEPQNRLNYKRFTMKNCRVNELNIDLDQIGNWRVENCEIDVENLTGAGYHHIEQSKKESKVINWHPKNKDARLEIKVAGGDSVQVKFK